MRAVLIILFLACLGAATNEFYRIDRGDIVSGDAVRIQKNTSTDHFSYRLERVGANERLAITLLLDGPSVLMVNEGTYDLDPDSDLCAPAEPGWLRCRVVMDRKLGLPIDLRVTPVTDMPLQVARFKITWITSHALSPLSYSPLWVILGLLVAAMPVIWLLHRHYAASQWALIALSLGCLALIQPFFTVVLAVFAAAMWQINVFINRIKDKTPRVLVLLVGASLLFLIAFKVFGPILQSWVHMSATHAVLLPLGISYFVMRVIDTQLKAYRRELSGYNFREFFCYLLFAPTVPAGPIETIENFRNNRLERIGADDLAYGLSRIIIGIAKKVLIADALLRPLVVSNLGPVALDPSSVDATSICILLLANFLFAYVDFSAYSDIAIGLSRLYGYRIKENFNWPILRRNLRIYWQNWHMSLSNWAMRNIYLPIAIQTRNKILPIYATMIAIGLWHSFGLSWLVWAAHHSTGLAFLAWLDKRRHGRPLFGDSVAGAVLGILLTVSYVALGHSFVLFDDVGTALLVYLRAIGISGLF